VGVSALETRKGVTVGCVPYLVWVTVESGRQVREYWQSPEEARARAETFVPQKCDANTKWYRARLIACADAVDAEAAEAAERWES
jgi:hypothetical protein